MIIVSINKMQVLYIKHDTIHTKKSLLELCLRQIKYAEVIEICNYRYIDPCIVGGDELFYDPDPFATFFEGQEFMKVTEIYLISGAEEFYKKYICGEVWRQGSEGEIFDRKLF